MLQEVRVRQKFRLTTRDIFGVTWKLSVHRYLELQQSGKLADTIQDLYNQGYKSKWKEANGITVT